MEPIPVPQNIIDAEFKLFGSFTVSQFIKILMGSFAALGIFFIDINLIIKLPLMLLAVGVGFMMAIMPGFPKLFRGFVRSIFISPRYVWVKEGNTPELFDAQIVKKVENDQSVNSAISKRKLDINSLPLQEMFSTRAKLSVQTHSDAQQQKTVIEPEDKIDVIMGEIFQQPSDNITALASQIKSQQPISNLNQSNNVPKRPLPTTPEELRAEIKRLKFELSKLARDDQFKQKEEQIIAQINELYREIKLLVGQPLEQKNPRVAAQLQEMQLNINAKEVYGKVVSKRDEPIANANVFFVNEQNQRFQTSTSNDGKFRTTSKLNPGDYSVYIESPGKRFHTYKIVVGAEGLPGYKFREK